MDPPAIISGATGPNAPSINGFFDPTSEIHEDRVRYCKRSDAGVCVKHIKAFKGAIMWQIKRASAKGSAFTWTSGERALEACRSSQWGRLNGTYIQMIGVKLQSAGRRRVQGPVLPESTTTGAAGLAIAHPRFHVGCLAALRAFDMELFS